LDLYQTWPHESLWKGKNPIYFGVITIILFDNLYRRAYFVMHTFLVFLQINGRSCLLVILCVGSTDRIVTTWCFLAYNDMNTPILIKKTIYARFGRIWNRNNFFMSKKKKKWSAEPVINTNEFSTLGRCFLKRVRFRYVTNHLKRRPCNKGVLQKLKRHGNGGSCLKKHEKLKIKIFAERVMKNHIYSSIDFYIGISKNNFL
jgi:hypothetical protein